MMSARTFKLFIALMISVTTVGYANPKETKEAKDKKVEKKEKLTLQGVYLAADAFGYIYPIFVKDRYYSSEVSATVNIGNRFFPVMEAGIGHTDMVSQLYDIGYSTRAPYYRIGMDYNMQYKNGRPNYIYLGGRVGYTDFKYSVDAPALIDPVWGNEVPVLFTDVPCRAIWAEAVGGVRAEIFKNLYMGWSLRYKYPIHKGPITNGGPWYIPGYGTGSKTAFGATYTVSYYFKLKR